MACICLLGTGCATPKGQATGENGSMRIMVTFSPACQVTDAKVIKSDAPQELQDYVLSHVKKNARAEPRFKDGRPVGSKVVVSVNYKVRDAKKSEVTQLSDVVVTPP
ncbi:energy transducer TonB [Brevifollis gellanilyticus]